MDGMERRTKLRAARRSALRSLLLLFIWLSSLGVSYLGSPSAASANTLPSIKFLTLPEQITVGSPASFIFTISGSLPRAKYDVYFAVYNRLLTRSDLQNERGRLPGSYPQAISGSLPLNQGQFPSGNGYSATLQVGGNGSSAIGLPNCSGDCSGNYPIELRVANVKTGAVLAESVAVIPILFSPPTHPLAVTLVSTFSPNRFSVPTLERLATFLSSHTSVPMALAISGSTLSQISSDVSVPAVKTALNTILAWAANSNHALIGSSFSPARLACLNSGKGLGSLTSQLTQSLKILSAVGSGRAQSQYLLLGPGVNSTVLSRAVRLGYSRLILPSNFLSALGLSLTLTSPVVVAGSGGTAIGADSLFTSELQSVKSPLSLQNVYADLAQVYFEAPNYPETRVLLGEVNLNNPSQYASLGAMLQDLSGSSLVSLTGLPQSFGLPAGQVLTASEVPEVGQSKGCQYLKTQAFRNVAHQINDLSSAAPSASVTKSLEEDYLTAQSIELSPTQRAGLLRQLSSEVGKQLSQISVQPGSNFTLTSKKSDIPLTITSHANYPLSVVVSVNSDKLSFPQGRTRKVLLSKQTSTISFPVAVKSPGSFPLDISVSAPNGSPLTKAVLGVRSATFSLAGLILTFGALAVFLTWWGRSILRAKSSARSTETDE